MEVDGKDQAIILFSTTEARLENYFSGKWLQNYIPEYCFFGDNIYKYMTERKWWLLVSKNTCWEGGPIITSSG
jgi:hypothetical protein